MQIIRGLPGAGKTTLALKEYPDIFRIEADMFFTRGGKYYFMTELVGESTKWFYDTIRLAVSSGVDIVLTGVFPGHSTSRLPNVIAMALENDYEVYIKTLLTDYGNTHGVPEKQLGMMKKAFVPEEVLSSIYAEHRQVHFGLMPRTEPIPKSNNRRGSHGRDKIQSQLPKVTRSDIS